MKVEKNIGYFALGTSFTITPTNVRNACAYMLTNATLTVTLPSGLSLTEPTVPKGEWNPSTFVWTIGGLHPGQYLETGFTFTVTEDCDQPYQIVFTLETDTTCGDECFDEEYCVTVNGVSCCQLFECYLPPFSGDIVYVAKYGDNATAERGNPLRPFSDMWGAKSILQSGDKMIVMPGVYTIGNVGSGADTELNDAGTTEADINLIQGIDELHIHFMDGAILHATATAPAAWGFGLISDENLSTKNITVTGHLVYRHEQSGWLPLFWQRNSGSTYNIKMKGNEQLEGGWLFYSDGNLNIDLDWQRGTYLQGFGFILADNSIKKIKIREVSGDNTYYGYAGFNTAWNSGVAHATQSGQIDIDIDNFYLSSTIEPNALFGPFGTNILSTQVLTGIQVNVRIKNYKDFAGGGNSETILDSLNYMRITNGQLNFEFDNILHGTDIMRLQASSYNHWNNTSFKLKIKNGKTNSSLSNILKIDASISAATMAGNQWIFDCDYYEKTLANGTNGAPFNVVAAIPAEPGVFIVKGNYKLTGASALVNTTQTTLSNHIMLQDVKIINDTTGAEVASTVAVNVLLQNGVTNAAAGDGDITYLGDTIIRNANYR